MAKSLIQPYLTFNGRCEEALDFYQEAVGAEVDMVLFYDEAPEPLPEGMLPPGFERKIMHTSFRIGDSVIMATDGFDPEGTFEGFSLFLQTPDEEAARKAILLLSADGEVTMPLGKTFWSPCFGMVTDKFGVSWMISVPGEAS